MVQAIYDKAMNEKKALADDAALCRLKMSAANTLIGMLGGERVRWTSQSKEYRAQIDRYEWQSLGIFIVYGYGKRKRQDSRYRC